MGSWSVVCSDLKNLCPLCPKYLLGNRYILHVHQCPKMSNTDAPQGHIWYAKFPFPPNSMLPPPCFFPLSSLFSYLFLFIMVYQPHFPLSPTFFFNLQNSRFHHLDRVIRSSCSSFTVFTINTVTFIVWNACRVLYMEVTIYWCVCFLQERSQVKLILKDLL